MKDRTGEVWFDSEGSTEPEVFLVTGGFEPSEWETDEPESVYHSIVMLYHGSDNGWREDPSEPWESKPTMRRIT